MLVVKPDPHNDSSDIKALNAYLDDVPCGFVRFRLNGYIMDITELLPLPEDPAHMDRETFAVLDTVMRALGSYGLNHSCFYLTCENPVLYPTLSSLRFTMQGGVMKSDLSKLLTHCGDGGTGNILQ